MLVTSYLLGWFLSHTAVSLDLSNHLDQLRSVKEAIKGTAAADFFDCPSERFVLQDSSRINLCSLNNDEKTRCGKSSRSMKMGGVRYVVPCKYDMKTHTCIENYNCNVPIIGTKKAAKQLNDRTTGVRKSKKLRTKKNEKFVHAPLLEDSQGCSSLHELMGTRESMGWNGGCIATSEEDCEKMYYSKLITGQAWKVPCIWMNSICQDDMTCAMMTSGTHVDTVYPTFGNTTRPTSATNTTYRPSPYRTIGPSSIPTVMPFVSTDCPTNYPSNPPTHEPTRNPTHDPSIHPTPTPTRDPTYAPTAVPTDKPTAEPTSEPTMTPTANPTATPTATPTAEPTAEPTATPTFKPTHEPTQEPTNTPTASPTFEPTAVPTANPTAEPTEQPTPSPTMEPTATPTNKPTAEPTYEPSNKPTDMPTDMPTAEPTVPVIDNCIDIDNRKQCVKNDDRCEWDKILQFCLPLNTDEPETAKPTARPSRFPTNPPTDFSGGGDQCEAYQWKYKGKAGLSKNDGVCCDALCPKCVDKGCKELGNDKYGVPFENRCCPGKIKNSKETKDKRCDKGDTPPCRQKKNQQCPCQPAPSQEPEGCSPEHLQEVIPDVFTPDQVEGIAEARENYDPVTAQWTFERTLLNTGIVNIWEVMLWYGHANCDAGIFDDIRPAPVKICLWESKASFHLVQNEQKENNLIGLTKNKLKLKFNEGEKPITLLKCAQEQAAEFIDEQGNSEELKMFSWQVDTNRAKYDTSRCTSFSETDTAPLEDSTDRAGSYVYSTEWLCPFPSVFDETCGAPDVFGTVLNPRVVPVGITDDACLCQTMCEERSAEDAKDFVAWNLQTSEGRCVCVYVGEKDEEGSYRTVDKINNLSGAMNGFKLQVPN